MAVALDAKMATGNSSDGLNQEAIGATSISSTGLTLVAATCLVGTLTFAAQSVSSAPTGVTMTWGGVSMTLRASVNSISGADYASSYTFSLVNPAPGTGPLAAAWTGAQDCYMSGIGFTGTDTVTGVNAADNITATQTTTLTVTSDANGATVANFAVDGSTPTVNFTKIWAEAPNSPGGGASYTLGNASNAHTFTGAGGTRQSIAGVHVIAASGAANNQLAWVRA